MARDGCGSRGDHQLRPNDHLTVGDLEVNMIIKVRIAVREMTCLQAHRKSGLGSRRTLILNQRRTREGKVSLMVQRVKYFHIIARNFVGGFIIHELAGMSLDFHSHTRLLGDGQGSVVLHNESHRSEVGVRIAEMISVKTHGVRTGICSFGKGISCVCEARVHIVQCRGRGGRVARHLMLRSVVLDGVRLAHNGHGGRNRVDGQVSVRHVEGHRGEVRICIVELVFGKSHIVRISRRSSGNGIAYVGEVGAHIVQCRSGAGGVTVHLVLRSVVWEAFVGAHDGHRGIDLVDSHVTVVIHNERHLVEVTVLVGKLVLIKIHVGCTGNGSLCLCRAAELNVGIHMVQRRAGRGDIPRGGVFRVVVIVGDIVAHDGHRGIDLVDGEGARLVGHGVVALFRVAARGDGVGADRVTRDAGNVVCDDAVGIAVLQTRNRDRERVGISFAIVLIDVVSLDLGGSRRDSERTRHNLHRVVAARCVGSRQYIRIHVHTLHRGVDAAVGDGAEVAGIHEARDSSVELRIGIAVNLGRGVHRNRHRLLDDGQRARCKGYIVVALLGFAGCREGVVTHVLVSISTSNGVRNDRRRITVLQAGNRSGQRSGIVAAIHLRLVISSHRGRGRRDGEEGRIINNVVVALISRSTGRDDIFAHVFARITLRRIGKESFRIAGIQTRHSGGESVFAGAIDFRCRNRLDGDRVADDFKITGGNGHVVVGVGRIRSGQYTVVHTHRLYGVVGTAIGDGAEVGGIHQTRDGTGKGGIGIAIDFHRIVYRNRHRLLVDSLGQIVGDFIVLNIVQSAEAVCHGGIRVCAGRGAVAGHRAGELVALQQTGNREVTGGAIFDAGAGAGKYRTVIVLLCIQRNLQSLCVDRQRESGIHFAVVFAAGNGFHHKGTCQSLCRYGGGFRAPRSAVVGAGLVFQGRCAGMESRNAALSGEGRAVVGLGAGSRQRDDQVGAGCHLQGVRRRCQNVTVGKHISVQNRIPHDHITRVDA